MAVEAVLSSTLSLIVELSASHVLECLSPVWGGVDEELQKLRRALLGIHAIIGDAEERQLKDKAVREWLNELKHAAYDAEDLLDKANSHVILILRKSELQGHRMSKVRNFFSLDNNPLFFLLKLGNELKSITRRIDGIMEEMRKFNFKVDTLPMAQRTRPQTHSFVIESEVIGRDEDKEKTVEMLISHHFDEKVAVFSIVGMGGLGKTTLAQLVYHDKRVERHFDRCIWVCVSHDFDVAKLTAKIIHTCIGESCDHTNMEVLQWKLREVLREKKYLLVLDDVWDVNFEKWDMLRRLLMFGGEGSRVVVTTRNEECSMVMNAQIIYRLTCLSEDSSWDLFEQRAFARDVPRHPNMVTIGKTVVRRCGGLPLAIKALGSLMLFKREERDWRSVMESEVWHLQPVEDEIRPVLWLSYVDMPSHLKKCFAFCATFPKDFELEKGMLIQLWMANGFIPSEGGTDLEAKGHEIFHELICRSFLQDVLEVKYYRTESFYCPYLKRNTAYGYRSRTTCKIHDLMHDLAEFSLGDECSPKLGSINPMGIPKVIRHVPIEAYDYSNLNDCLRIRTVFGTRKFLHVVEKLKFLRTLKFDLISEGIDELPASIGHMKHLRYLEMGLLNIKSLPEAICMLINLQTLKLKQCYSLLELPKSIRYMSSLRHLHISKCVKLRTMPAGLSQLRCLKTLTNYIVGDDAENGIGQLKHLNLGGKLKLYNLHKIKNADDAKEGNLCSKQDIHSLTLCWGGKNSRKKDNEYREVANAEEVLGALKPHCNNIKVLTVGDYSGIRFPVWMGEMENLRYLVEIHLFGCRRCEQLPPLQQLPLLEILTIAKMNGIKHVINNSGSDITGYFPALKMLKLDQMRNLERWCIEEEREAGSCFFPVLVSIHILECPKLTTMPCIPSLRKLKLSRSSDVPLTSWGSGFFKHFTSLEILKISGFEELVLLLEDEEETSALRSSLRKIEISNCNRLSSTGGLWNLPFVTSLKVQMCDALVSFAEQMPRGLKSLKDLYILECQNLTGLSEPPSSQQDCALTCLEQLTLISCHALIEPPKCLRSLQKLFVVDCQSFKFLNEAPENLTYLHVFSCSSFTSLSQSLTSLRHLFIENCPLMKSFPESLTSLEYLSLKDCPLLKSFPESLPNLRSLTIEGCMELERQCKTGGKYRKLVSDISYTSIQRTVPGNGIWGQGLRCITTSVHSCCS